MGLIFHSAFVRRLSVFVLVGVLSGSLLTPALMWFTSSSGRWFLCVMQHLTLSSSLPPQHNDTYKSGEYGEKSMLSAPAMFFLPFVWFVICITCFVESSRGRGWHADVTYHGRHNKLAACSIARTLLLSGAERALSRPLCDKKGALKLSRREMRIPSELREHNAWKMTFAACRQHK